MYICSQILSLREIDKISWQSLERLLHFVRNDGFLIYFKKMKNTFRIVSYLEGISYILLLFIATPVKYFVGDESYVKMLGMPHGILFMVYVILAFMLKSDEKWNNKTFGIVLVASILPFGTFYVDKKYLQN
tara:strand:+ start:2186 stop:2578 length:393 start_codon:yes stop_codon:yes gene_type:complete